MASTVEFPGMTLLHNPRCSKSRAAKALLEERGVRFHERRYLDEPLSRGELEALHARLGRSPREWIRSKEADYAAAGLNAASSDAQLLDAIAAHPALLERPILVDSARAALGRPPESILAILQ